MNLNLSHIKCVLCTKFHDDPEHAIHCQHFDDTDPGRFRDELANSRILERTEARTEWTTTLMFSDVF